MISNERHWPVSSRPFQRQPYQPYYERPQQVQPRPTLREDTIQMRELQIERKNFRVMLKENPRGKFVRISEETNGRFNSIMIPCDGLKDFLKMLEEIVESADSIPATAGPLEPQPLP